MSILSKEVLIKAFSILTQAKCMTEIYEANFKQVSKYVHATSRGHEVIQIAAGLLTQPQDYLGLYYRDDAFLLSIGMRPYDAMLQLFAKKDDPFSGGRSYYCHPSLKLDDKPKIPHQSSATGMQAIPMTGVAMGIQIKSLLQLSNEKEKEGIVICSIGDAAMTEGEVSEAMQMAALKQLPIIYLVQDNGWDISATAEETRAMNAYEFCQGFKGIEAISIDGTDFDQCYATMHHVINTCRKERRPFLVHAKVPLLNHHTSGVRMEWYRHDLEEHQKQDPYYKMIQLMLDHGIGHPALNDILEASKNAVAQDFVLAEKAPDPSPEDLYHHDFAPAAVMVETGIRQPEDREEKVMVDCALLAIQEMMEDHKEVLLYGQDVGRRLGGVFREASTLAEKFGDDRVFNTAIQEAFIVGSTVGMSAVGLKPIVEVQFADYIWPGLNQLFSEVSRSCYLSNGKFPVNMTLRVPIGAYGSGGPYHSSSVESVLTNIRGIKIAYPSNGADLFGLMKSAILDPNPVVIFEHKGLYWSKVKGTEFAKSVLPSRDYRLPFGKGHMLKEANDPSNTNSVLIVTYGMGVHWALNAAKNFNDNIGILDLRTLFPLDEDLIFQKTRSYNKVVVVTEEPVNNTFAQSLAGRIQQNCFSFLDAPVFSFGSECMPAIPLNEILEKTMVYTAEKLTRDLEMVLKY